MADRVDEIVAAPFELDGVAFRLRASIAPPCVPTTAATPRCFSNAEVAMYVAKEKGSRFQVYSPTIDRHDPRRLALIGELHDAIGSGQLVVHYQPVASLATGEVTAAEALVRWQHPEHGVVLPDEFISLAETTGDIDELTLYVAREAVAQ